MKDESRVQGSLENYVLEIINQNSRGLTETSSNTAATWDGERLAWSQICSERSGHLAGCQWSTVGFPWNKCTQYINSSVPRPDRRLIFPVAIIRLLSEYYVQFCYSVSKVTWSCPEQSSKSDCGGCCSHGNGEPKRQWPAGLLFLEVCEGFFFSN